MRHVKGGQIYTPLRFLTCSGEERIIETVFRNLRPTNSLIINVDGKNEWRYMGGVEFKTGEAKPKLCKPEMSTAISHSPKSQK